MNKQSDKEIQINKEKIKKIIAFFTCSLNDDSRNIMQLLFKESLQISQIRKKLHNINQSTINYHLEQISLTGFLHQGKKYFKMLSRIEIYYFNFKKVDLFIYSMNDKKITSRQLQIILDDEIIFKNTFFRLENRYNDVSHNLLDMEIFRKILKLIFKKKGIPQFVILENIDVKKNDLKEYLYICNKLQLIYTKQERPQNFCYHTIYSIDKQKYVELSNYAINQLLI